MKKKVPADAACRILQGLVHEPDPANAGQKEDATAEVLALHQEIDGENNDHPEGTNGAQKVHQELDGRLQAGSANIPLVDDGAVHQIRIVLG